MPTSLHLKGVSRMASLREWRSSPGGRLTTTIVMAIPTLAAVCFLAFLVESHSAPSIPPKPVPSIPSSSVQVAMGCNVKADDCVISDLTSQHEMASDSLNRLIDAKSSQLPSWVLTIIDSSVTYLIVA